MFSDDDSPRDTENVRDYFAPAQFREMPKWRRLSSPSFEKMDSGLKLGNTTVVFGHDELPPLNVEYDTMMIALEDEDSINLETHPLDGDSLDYMTALGASEQSHRKEEKYQGNVFSAAAALREGYAGLYESTGPEQTG